jgi:hypothetical protein
MAFLDNSGDIILDVVLTDEGRKRLAQGDGSFKIDKYAFGDDEINYALYNTSAASGQEDLQILQTPILESFTNNMSSMKSTLINLSRNDHLYLPVLKLNNVAASQNYQFSSPAMFMVAVDLNTQDNSATQATPTSVALDPSTVLHRDGFLKGATPNQGGTVIRVDAGVDNTSMPASVPLTNPQLRETSYEIKIDNRLGSIISKAGTIVQPVELDDDYVATYVVGGGGVLAFVSTNNETQTLATEVIAGARSTILEFKIASSQNLRSSFHLFNMIGSDGTMASPASSTQAIKFIDSVVRVTGQLTGYSIDIPVRFVKNI